MTNGEGIEKSFAQLDQDINLLLANEELSTRELVKGLLRTQRSMLPFLSQAVANAKQVAVMWAVFRPALVAGSVMMTLILGLLWGIFTGQIELMIK